MSEQQVATGKISKLLGAVFGTDSMTTCLRGVALVIIGLVVATVGDFFDGGNAARFFGTLGKLSYGPGAMFISAGLLRAILTEAHQQWVKVALVFSTLLFLAFTILGGMV
jgi:hypothetical protein